MNQTLNNQAIFKQSVTKTKIDKGTSVFFDILMKEADHLKMNLTISLEKLFSL